MKRHDSPEAREIGLLLDKYGTFVRYVKHGTLWRIGNNMVQLPGSAGDCRSWKNALAHAKRALRTTGILRPR